MDQEKLNLIEQFTNVTGDNDQASSYLESSNWNLEVAVNLYFQGGLNNQPNINTTTKNDTPVSPQNNYTSNKPTTTNPNQRKVHGFNDYKVEEKKDDKQQEYYAGGKNSGIAVMTPGQEKDIMEKATNSGAKVDTHDKQNLPKFSGAGFKLGDSQTFNDNPLPQKEIIRIITMYKNGFTVDDGPLRALSDPANKDFLNDISNGHVPRELEREAKGKELKVDLVDKRGEEYTPPPKKVEYFSGTGVTLGVTTTKVTEIKEDLKFHVDENQPFTEIRIRLGNGKTVVGKFNLTHTIGDIKKYVSDLTSVPPFQFDLMNSFPKEIFKDNNKTIKDAGLVKGNILQKLN